MRHLYQIFDNNLLYYFMPYAKGKGIRDLYQIEVARIGTKHEFVETADENDFRLVFEIKFVAQLFDDYNPIKLMIYIPKIHQLYK